MNTELDLNMLINAIINDKTEEIKTIYEFVFGNYYDKLSMSNSNFIKNIEQLASCFDLNDDGVYSLDDLKYLKNLDANTIMKIVNAAIYIGQLINELKNVEIHANDMVDLTYRVIVYAILVPLLKNSKEFMQNWLNENNNREQLIQYLTILHKTILTSAKITNVVSFVIKYVKSHCSCVRQHNSTKNIDTINRMVTSEVSEINRINSIYTQKKLMRNMNIQLNFLLNNNNDLK